MSDPSATPSAAPSPQMRHLLAGSSAPLTTFPRLAAWESPERGQVKRLSIRGLASPPSMLAASPLQAGADLPRNNGLGALTTAGEGAVRLLMASVCDCRTDASVGLPVLSAVANVALSRAIRRVDRFLS